MYDSLHDVILGDTAENLRCFFQRICMQPHKYIVINARRCINLYYLFQTDGFFDEALRARRFRLLGNPTPTEDDPVWTRIMSNNALLMHAKEIAEVYDQVGIIPPILLVDEMILHGRGLYRLLYALEEGIRLYSSQDYTNSFNRVQLHRALIQAVDIYVFAMNKHILALETAFAQKINANFYCSTTDLRILSSKITKSLLADHIPYTSYVFSRFFYHHMIPSQPKDGWYMQDWYNHNIPYRIFLKSSSFPHTAGAILCVPSNDAPHQFRITSRFLTDSISESDLSNILLQMAAPDFLDLSRFFDSDILRGMAAGNQLPTSMHYLRWQILSFIISSALAIDFIRTYHLDGVENVPEYGFYGNIMEFQKYSDNFGISIADIKTLLKLISFNSNYKKCLRLLKMNHSSSPQYSPLSDADIEHFIHHVEDIIYYSGGMAAEQEAYWIEQNRIIYDPSIPHMDVMLLKKYYNSMIQCNPKLGNSLYTLFCCLSVFSETGILSLNSCYDPEEKNYYLSMKAGELATFIIPRRICSFIPALSEIERYYWQNQNLLIEKLLEFIQELKDTTPSSQKSEARRNRVQTQLDYLYYNSEKILKTIYSSGHTFSGWNIDWNTEDVWMDNTDFWENWNDLFDQSGSKIYLDKAREFLSRSTRQLSPYSMMYHW